jgi:hypothetical protein
MMSHVNGMLKSNYCTYGIIVSFQKQRYHVCEILGDRRGYSYLKEEALSIALSGGIVL